MGNTSRSAICPLCGEKEQHKMEEGPDLKLNMTRVCNKCGVFWKESLISFRNRKDALQFWKWRIVQSRDPNVNFNLRTRSIGEILIYTTPRYVPPIDFALADIVSKTNETSPGPT